MEHKHEWVVFSTCLNTVELMVECAQCGAFGTVPEPTKQEWSAAFYAPSHPYAWAEDDRVVIHDDLKVEAGQHVVRISS